MYGDLPGLLLMYPRHPSTTKGIQTDSVIPFNNTMLSRRLVHEISEPHVRALLIFRIRTPQRFRRILVQSLVNFARLPQSTSTCLRTCLARFVTERIGITYLYGARLLQTLLRRESVQDSSRQEHSISTRPRGSV